MREKCRRAKGARLQLCEAATHAVQTGMVRLQHLLDMETGARRQQLAIVKGREWAPFNYCPWCRADIDTTPREPAPKEAP